MIAYLCNSCKKPLDLDNDKDVAHLFISMGKRAIDSGGKYADNSWDADLCGKCFRKLCPFVDDYYNGGNKYLNKD